MAPEFEINMQEKKNSDFLCNACPEASSKSS
jgi:hypothetical protein